MDINKIPVLNLLNKKWFDSKRFIAASLAIVSIFLLYMITTVNLSSALEQVKKRGQLVALTRNSSTTYYEGPEGKLGFEYDLANMFAKELGVKLVMKTPEPFADVFPLLSGANADMIAAGVAITKKRQQVASFTQPYLSVTQQLVYKSGISRPKNIGETKGKTIAVIAGSSHVDNLLEYQQKYPEISWQEVADASPEELLEAVNNREYEFTIADSNEIQVSRRFYPELRVAFNIGASENIAWAFKKSEDTSLVTAANQFLDKISNDGRLTQLIERYFGHIKKFDYVDKTVFLKHIENRLPLYELSFKQAAKETEIDWRLLAAVGYQESHWDAYATSPTGVRGLMMLTNITAAEMNVKNRLDPRQSIFAGARYLRKSIDRVPPSVENPDRVWMGMAAYNVGFGHLEDARILAKKFNKNPDVWVDVKTILPLLSRQKYHRLTKHGYARGQEPVTYVGNIRDYYDILLWYTEQKNHEQKPNEDTIKLQGPSAL